MTNYCVDHRKCGTSDPIYLSGNITSPVEKVVDVKACVRTFQNCCEHTLNLKMKNCVYFMVYCFLDLHPACHSRFCFDVDLSVETTSTSKTTTTATTTTSTARTTTTTTSTTTTSPPPTTDDNKSQKRHEEDDKPCRRANKNRNEVAVPLLLALISIALVTIIVLCAIIYWLRRQQSLDHEQRYTDLVVPSKEDPPAYENSTPANEKTFHM